MYDLEDKLLQRERDIADELMTVVVALLSQRSWSQCKHSNSLPDLFCTAFGKTAAEADAGISNARHLWQSVLLAIRCTKVPTRTSAALVDCLDDIFWKDDVFVQEACILLERANWDHADPEVRAMIWPYAGTMCNTKFPNEDVFNTLRDEQRHGAAIYTPPPLRWLFGPSSGLPD